jgi:FAD/FMN-containing dehydrogenase
MVANNCAGEKTLKYGKMENLLLETKVIFADGNEYTVKPLSDAELEAKIGQNDFEGNLYKQLYELIEKNREIIKNAKPGVSKNSAGYFLWNVYDEKEGIFDLNKLIAGSQGTLGIVTEAKLKLVPVQEHHDMLAIFFKSWDELPHVVNALLPLAPESLETFDEETLKLGLRFMPEVAKKAGSGLVRFALKFLPEALIGAKMLGLPKLIVLAEFVESSESEVKEKMSKAVKALEGMHVWTRAIVKDSDEEKFWIMRRESFSLLRKHVHGKRTVPLVDDFCIQPDKMPEFLPKAKKILEDAGIKVNIAGHAGNGNYHIIPLMDMRLEGERAKLPEVADRFYDLVGEFGGSITAEHNDGIVRTPYLGKMYSPEILDLFKQTKQIFDPHNIFNPGKKVPTATKGTVEYMSSHIAVEG